MTAKGLQGSIYASSRASCPITRPGDWPCTNCGFSNFAFREKCLHCSQAQSIVMTMPRALSTITNGTIANGQLPIASTPQTTFHCGENVPSAARTTTRVRKLEQGLAESLWAPKNAHLSGINQIWTRVTPRVPTAIPVQSSTPATPPDLGLPYEVQHYVLAMIQRILEEACYDLASRWIPQKLRENRWDCPEAVELSTWRTILPTALPPNAILQHPTYTLSKALADAVQIRNAAVHRHLCDNTEIRRMIIKAQDIMAMFADHTRRNKFQRLWVELNDWDRNSDHQTKKEKLLAALGEISERPVDDMDWTPNSVSMQEVTGVVAPEVVHDQYYGDAMDLD